MTTRFRAWLFYAVAGAVAVAVGGWIAVLAGAESGAVAVAGGVAYAIQLAAFGLLIMLRTQPQLFMVAWLAGMVFRFGALGVCAFWLSRTGALPLSTTLLSLVGFLFLLLVIEPLFLRHGGYDTRV
ncbi:MAG: hypothetical protein ACT4O1_12615 [Gemmatimonadota bacterium]